MSADSPPTTSRPTCASTSTSPSPGCSSPAGTTLPPPCSPGCSRRPRRAGGSGASSRSSCSQALAAQARGDVPAALEALRRALALAEAEGVVRVVADEGPPIAALLRTLPKQDPAYAYGRRLLAACAGISSPGPALVDPLSDRELDVLRLLGSDLDGPDIARELSVSLNTMRTHTKSIYAKLGVTSRRAAVRRAHDLGVLPRRR